MKNYALIISLLLLSNFAWSQNPNLDYKHAVKIYNVSTYSRTSNKTFMNDSLNTQMKEIYSSFQFFNPSIALQWATKRNNFHEISMGNMQFGKTQMKREISSDSSATQVLSGYQNKTSSMAGRYEFILNFNKSKDTKFVPSLGFGVSPYFSMSRSKPLVASAFPTSQNRIGFNVFIAPRLTYYFSSKFFLDVNIPICLVDNYMQINKSNNPILPAGQGTVSTYNINQFPKIFTGRVGIGLKI